MVERVFCRLEYFQPFEHVRRLFGAREHALDGTGDDPGRIFFHDLLKGDSPHMPHIAGMVIVDLLNELIAGDLDQVSVDHDHEIAAIYIVAEIPLAFATQDLSYLGRQSP